MTRPDTAARRVLTDAFVRSLRADPGGRRYAVSDALVPGLKVRVMRSGAKTFVLWKRWGGARNPSVRALGRVGELSLAEAREKARVWLELRARGQDPREIERARREAEAESRATTFGAVMEDYIRRAVSGRRRAVDDEREIRRELMSRWRKRPLTSITRRDVVRMVEEIADRGAQRQAHNIFGHARSFFAWAVERGVYGLDVSPCQLIRPAKLIGAKRSRERVLTDSEIGALWRACGRLGHPFGPAHRLLLLTGQRKSDVGDATWPEFDLDARLWRIPRQRFKSGVEHVVPLSDDAVSLLRALPRFARGNYLFSTDGRQAATGYSTAKERIDKFMAEEQGRIEPFVIHDIRRTVRTRLSALRVPSEVAEAVIGHGRRGIARVYDRHRYLDEMRAALDAWAGALRAIVDPPAGNVVRLAKRRARKGA